MVNPPSIKNTESLMKTDLPNMHCVKLVFLVWKSLLKSSNLLLTFEALCVARPELLMSIRLVVF